MQSLYPAIKPYKTHQLAVDAIHSLYIEETGNPNGIPVLVLHSGPGGGGLYYLRRFFDPERYRIIFFDQRGCGKSTPHVELQNNTTAHLLSDIDHIRNHLAIPRLILWGGGWGCLLALLYAEKHPEAVQGLLLHRIFLGRQQDIDWFYRLGTNRIYPDYWQDLVQDIPKKSKLSIPQYFMNMLQSDNELARMSAAKIWALWQVRSSCLQVHQKIIDEYQEPHFALSLATLETHYITNHYFIEENQVLRDAKIIQHIPTYLVHGRYDMVSPLSSALDLQQALPQAKLSIVRDAGHSDRESGIIDALIMASKELVHHDLDAS